MHFAAGEMNSAMAGNARWHKASMGDYEPDGILKRFSRILRISKGAACMLKKRRMLEAAFQELMMMIADAAHFRYDRLRLSRYGGRRFI